MEGLTQKATKPAEEKGELAEKAGISQSKPVSSGWSPCTPRGQSRVSL